MEDECLSYPLWLPRAMQRNNGPSIAFKYCLSTDRDITSARAVPLLCVYPTIQVTEDVRERPSFQFEEFQFKLRRPESPSARSCLNPATSTSSKPLIQEKHLMDTSRIPVEIFEHIIKDISRTDARNLRLVDKAFERGVSRALFQTVVVPFGTEIYGLLHQQHGGVEEVDGQREGLKSFVGAPSMNTLEYSWKAAFVPGLTLESQHDRLHMFRQFGAHIRQFGMSLEVKQKDLLKLATKTRDEYHPTFWGTYDWPMAQYSRYSNRARLENVADETSTMKAAFACLTSVKHLALSVDSGIGWIRGPDTSMRSVILETPSAVFQSLHFERSDPTTTGQRCLWELLEASYTKVHAIDQLRFAEMNRVNTSRNNATACKGSQQLHYPWVPVRDSLVSSAREKAMSKEAHDRVPSSALPGPDEAGEAYLDVSSDDEDNDTDQQLISSVKAQPDLDWSTNNVDKQNPNTGILLVEPTPKASLRSSKKNNLFDKKLIPTALTEAQTEWLMESVWVQDAFLSSYILAVESFNNVQKLTLSRLSSRFITKFLRHDFWKALSTLSDLKICVIADWLDLTTEAGYTTSRRIRPSDAIKPFQSLLGDFIAHQPNIVTLNIGWAEGGEHGEGLLARNNHLLPAPLMARESLLLPDSKAKLLFPHVRRLTFENCWITPQVLTKFVDRHSRYNLEAITLESVSLTGPPNGVQNAGNQQANPVNMANMITQLTNVQLPAAAYAVNQTPAITQGGPVGNPPPANPGAGVATAALVAQFLANHYVGPQGYRQGSWPTVLRQLRMQWKGKHRPRLEVLFRSCGYVKLASSLSMDERDFDNVMSRQDVSNTVNEFDSRFKQRCDALVASKMMFTDNEALHGSIVSALPPLEIDALLMDWGLSEGWPTREFLDKDYDDEGGWGKFGEKTKDAPVYDGYHPGGSGRFSGTVVLAHSSEGES